MRCLQVFGYCIFKNGREAKIDYPIQGFAEGTAGRSFHNGRFVQRLRRRAASQPNVTVRQGIVKRLLGSEFSPALALVGWLTRLCRDDIFLMCGMRR